VNTAKPRYQQLKDLIIQRISTGELQPSDRVPSENELVEAMSVSRMTANRALRELNDEGYVKRIAGRGTFVSDFRSQSHLLEVQNIADEIAGRGHNHSCTVIRQSRQHARGEVARALHVEQGTDIFHLQQGEGGYLLEEHVKIRPVDTPAPGIFAAGDVRHGVIRRVASAVGQGAVAVSLIHKYLETV